MRRTARARDWHRVDVRLRGAYPALVAEAEARGWPPARVARYASIIGLRIMRRHRAAAGQLELFSEGTT